MELVNVALKYFTHWAFVLLFGATTFAHPSQQSTNCLQGLRKVVEESRSRVLTKLSMRRGKPVNYMDLALKLFDADETTGIQKLQLRFRGHLVAEATLQAISETMRFDIDIAPRFHRLGIYQYLLARALLEFPDVSSIPSIMSYAVSENARRFVHSISPSKAAYVPKFSAARLSRLSAQEVQDLRGEILQALAQMPAIRVRDHLGFSWVEKVVLRPHPRGAFNEVGILVHRGPRTDPNQVRVFVRPYHSPYERLTSPFRFRNWAGTRSPRLQSARNLELQPDGRLAATAKQVTTFLTYETELPVPEMSDEAEGLYGSGGRDAYFRKF